MREPIVRISFEEHLVYGNCPIKFSSSLQTARESKIKEIGIVGIELKGDLLLFPALIQPPHIIQKTAKTSVGVRAVGVERDGPLVLFFCPSPVPRTFLYAS